MKSFTRYLATFLLAGLAVLFGVSPVYAQNASVSIVHDLLPTEGSQPSPPIIGTDGNLYFSCFYGDLSDDDTDLGTIIKMTPTGEVKVLYGYAQAANIGRPGPLVEGNDTALYGVATNTVFRITMDGAYSTLYTEDDGEQPRSNFPLAAGSDGNLYGYSLNSSSGGNVETLFSITTSGVPTPVHTFTPDEAGPYQTDLFLVRGQDGAIYGMTFVDADAPSPNPDPSPYGIFFTISPTGQYTLLHVFSGGIADGAAAYYTTMTQGSDGNFYFTGSSSPAYPSGTLSRISTDGSVTILHAFDPAYFSAIYGSLAIGADGNFYGQEMVADESNLTGVVFRLSADGSVFSELATFPLTATNYGQTQPLVPAGDGSFYGVTEQSIYRTAIYAPVKPVITISATPMKIAEKDGVRAKVIVQRSGDDLTSPLMVKLQFGGTAINGKDYKKLAPTVTIPAGSAKGVFYVKALNVGRQGGHQTLNINIVARANGSYTAGKPSKATVTIKDNG